MLDKLDVSIVLGLDGRTLDQLRISIPTWRMFWPELFEKPWVIFFDEKTVEEQRIFDVVDPHENPHRGPVLMYPWSGNGEYVSQREKMLTGFVFASMAVRTKWWMKIDTDALCLRRDPAFILPEWFDPEPAWIANRWGYTKVKGDNRTIHEWSESLESWGDEAFGQTPRLGLVNHINENGDKIIMPRMASWLSIYNSDWTDRLMFKLEGWKLPVPSQDTVHWYAAARLRSHVVRTSFKRRGWTNVPSIDKLSAMAAEITG